MVVEAEAEELSSDRLRAASRSDIVKAVPDRMLVKERAAWRSCSVRGGVVVVVGDVVVMALLFAVVVGTFITAVGCKTESIFPTGGEALRVG